MKILKDKTALITGGTGALGQVVAERFIQEGTNVAASYLFEDELKRLTSDFRDKVFLIKADVTNDTEVASMFDKIKKKFARIDILINIVGGFLARVNIKDVKTKDWDHMMSMNLKSVFLCAREFLQHNSKSSYGRIISISAMPAIKPSAGRGPYAVSKAGVVVLTQILGEELKGTGITANAIAPSILRTSANIASMPDEDISKWVSPKEVAETMCFLCSEHGQSINGACIPMFGGVS